MEAMQQQIALMVQELEMLKTEMVASKAAHATLHQNTVDRAQEVARQIEEIGRRIAALSDGRSGGTFGDKRRALIEPKQINVPIFAGAVTDSRAKFLEWAEAVQDRTGLFS